MGLHSGDSQHTNCPGLGSSLHIISSSPHDLGLRQKSRSAHVMAGRAQVLLFTNMENGFLSRADLDLALRLLPAHPHSVHSCKIMCQYSNIAHMRTERKSPPKIPATALTDRKGSKAQDTELTQDLAHYETQRSLSLTTHTQAFKPFRNNLNFSLLCHTWGTLHDPECKVHK